MIQERRCSYEVCKLLHEKGFDELCGYLYCFDELVLAEDGYDNRIKNSETTCKEYITAPTHQMACDWLREEHNIFIEISVSIDLNGDYHYSYFILNKSCKYLRKGYTSFDWTYKDAVEAALKYSLENLI